MHQEGIRKWPLTLSTTKSKFYNLLCMVVKLGL